MANTIAGNAYYIDTTATYVNIQEIIAIKVLGASTSSVTLASASSGNKLFFSDAATTQLTEPAEIRCTEGVTVTITGTAKVIIYERTRR